MTWDEIVEFLLGFPDTELTTTWNHPAVKTGGVLVTWFRDEADSPGAVAFKTDPAERQALIDDPSSPVYTIEHFEKFGTKAVLVQPDELDRTEFEELLTDAWLNTAKARARREWESR